MDIKPSRKETQREIYEMLSSIITAKSTRTKNELIKYTRKNFEGPSAYKDVGTVASKILKAGIDGKEGEWELFTEQKHVRNKNEEYRGPKIKVGGKWYYEKSYNYVIKNNLWLGFARVRKRSNKGW